MTSKRRTPKNTNTARLLGASVVGAVAGLLVYTGSPYLGAIVLALGMNVVFS
jgi:hypothetical protein